MNPKINLVIWEEDFTSFYCLNLFLPMVTPTGYSLFTVSSKLYNVCHLQATTAQSRQTVIETCEEGIKLLHFLLILKTS